MTHLFCILTTCFSMLNGGTDGHEMAYSQSDQTDELTLMQQVEANNLEGVRALITKGVVIDAPNAKGETPLLRATQLNYVDIANVLLHAGANVNKQSTNQDSPFLYACAQGRTAILLSMLNYKPDIKVLNRYGGNGLISAAEKGHIENVRMLLEQTDMDVNLVNRLGWTALLETIILTDGGKTSQDIVRLLIKHGADVNLPDSKGVTPLGNARIQGYTEIEQLLIEAGAH